MRATSSATLTFGLVTLPVKLYVSASPNEVSFNMITPGGNRVKQVLQDAVSGETVNRDDCQKGYEYQKGKYVVFSKDEIKALESTDTSKVMQITEFVPVDSIDPIAVEKTYFLGPDKGGDRAYQLLASTLAKLGRAAIAQWTARGKERLVAVRAFRGGLLLQELFYADEVRDIADVTPGESKIAPIEEELAEKLVSMMGVEAFNPKKYSDGYATRVRNAIDAKVSGQEFTVEPSPVPATALDLFAALKASLESKN